MDSADGIVAGYGHALRTVGVEPPPEEVLRADLGPPVGELFAGLGLAPDQIEVAVAAYRHYYRETGMGQATVYPGVVDLLDRLAPVAALGTATAKLTTVAQSFLERYDLRRRFAVVNGTDDTHHTKTETLTRTLELLGSPDPARVLMVGDRHIDISAAHACGVRSVGVLWGYGTAAELEASSPDHLIREPDELLSLLG